MEKVSFKQMKDGTKEDYLLLEKHEKKFIEGTGQRILKFMSNLNHTLEGYQVSRLEHSLQTATRALNEKANDEMIVAALLHDIGDDLSPLNHAEYAAAVLKPYVSESIPDNILKEIFEGNTKNALTILRELLDQGIEAKYFLSKFKERYPAVFKFLEYQERLALSQGFVETLLGRRRYFHFNKNGLGRRKNSVNPSNCVKK